MTTLKRRPEFLAVNAGARASKPGFVLLGLAREAGEPHIGAETIRFGLTVTKKIGKAVKRNRARRRLRAIAQSRLPELGRPGWDYVLIARDGAVTRPFAALQGDLESALEMLHKARRPDGAGRARRA
ncbi:MAG: ribonuclease P protein component [Alphaproteobacteria bacterium]